jgi:outer membrane protein
MLSRVFALFALCFVFAGSAFAETKIAVVNFQKALDSVNEAASVRSSLEKMYSDRKATIEKMKTSLESSVADYQKQEMLLSDSAKEQKQKELYQKQAEFAQTQARYEGEMQEAYATAMQKFIDKMKTIAGSIGKERGYNLVLETTEGGVVYSDSTIDITDELIRRYNAGK